MSIPTLTPLQTIDVRAALDLALVILREHLRDEIESGSAALAAHTAQSIMRVERASHIAWGLPNEFPTDSEVL